jgi:hypothetical protein
VAPATVLVKLKPKLCVLDITRPARPNNSLIVTVIDLMKNRWHGTGASRSRHGRVTAETSSFFPRVFLPDL